MALTREDLEFWWNSLAARNCWTFMENGNCKYWGFWEVVLAAWFLCLFLGWLRVSLLFGFDGGGRNEDAWEAVWRAVWLVFYCDVYFSCGLGRLQLCDLELGPGGMDVAVLDRTTEAPYC